jgi:hypothetical protein
VHVSEVKYTFRWSGSTIVDISVEVLLGDDKLPIHTYTVWNTSWLFDFISMYDTLSQAVFVGGIVAFWGCFCEAAFPTNTCQPSPSPSQAACQQWWASFNKVIYDHDPISVSVSVNVSVTFCVRVLGLGHEHEHVSLHHLLSCFGSLWELPSVTSAVTCTVAS